MFKVAHKMAPTPAESGVALAGALEMAALGFPVFPLKPGTKDRFLAKSWKAQATTEEGRIRALAAEHPGCNWAARCTGHLVIDVDVADGASGEASYLLLDVEHGLPVTRVHRSARGGRHVFLKMPAGAEATNRDKPCGEGINIRGNGGFVVCPGSTFDGRPYTVEHRAPIAPAPESLVTLLRAPEAAKGGPVADEYMDHPAAIAGAVDWLQRREVARKGERGSSVYKAAARLRDWGLSEEVTLELIGAVYAPNMDPPADVNFCRHEVGSAFRYAQNTAGVRSVAVDFDDVSELAAELAPPADAAPIARGEELRWPVTDEDGKPIHKAHANIKAFLHYVGVHVYRDTFSSRDMLGGLRSGPFSDDALVFLHQRAFALGLSVPKEHFRDALKMFAQQSERHPVREYLDALKWDGVPRVEGWLTRYLGAEDTPLHRGFGRLWLVAAVRRVRQPGCKFDNMLVLEGAQGAGKSTALKIIAGEWFEESMTLAAEPKEVIEQTRGKWIVEFAELSGIRKREVEHVKTLITRTSDSARLAYKEFEVTVPRQFILAATTNDEEYLQDPSGHRRFWPVKVGTVDLPELKTDRDQLLAEAAAIEAEGGPLSLARDLWAAAAVVQTDREVADPLEDKANRLFGSGWGYVPNEEISNLLGFQNPTSADHRRVCNVMRKVEGWRRARIDGRRVHCRWPEHKGKPPRFEVGRANHLTLVHDSDAFELLG